MKKLLEVFKPATTWLIIAIACVSAAILSPDNSKADSLFQFWGLVSFIVWYVKL